MTTGPTYELHSLGWKSFQDLCVAIAEECLKRPVQMFLPSKDAGRDGAFVGTWETEDVTTSSVIQCKFTSLPHEHLSLSMLEDELEKAKALVERGLAADYVILTNHPITGASELKIKEAFKKTGVRDCRVFGKDWIVQQIQMSPRLRMMVPRLYGLGDLSNILDGRAYEQASMILSTMGDDLKRLVVTDAHRKSVEAVTEHNFVLLLGAPAAGKSTIGASLAVGATDLWQSLTIKSVSPAEIRERLNPNERQFFWIDDAWGATQYQKHTIEEWNQTLPLMQSAVQRGTQFLLTSRDYIWKAAQRDLKTQAFPVLERSKVIINVQALTPNERAQILYNHIKLGDQPRKFRAAIKPALPALSQSDHFLPETARRLGSTFFYSAEKPTQEQLLNYFEHPAEFLLDTIRNLASDCLAAIALIFLSGGRVPSPVPDTPEIALAQKAFGTNPASIRDALNAMNGSLLLLAFDDGGRYWTYKHPTVGDAFARFVAGDPELTEVYLRGARPEFILREVVCAGTTLMGASVCVPEHLFPLLLDRIESQQAYLLAGFLSYRADRRFADMLLKRRADLLMGLKNFSIPVAEDSSASLLARLHEFGLLPESLRLNFVEFVKFASGDEADASFLRDPDIRRVMTEDEIDSVLREAEARVLQQTSSHIRRVRLDWNSEYAPDEHFNELFNSIETFATEISWRADYKAVVQRAASAIEEAVAEMEEDYDPPKTVSASMPVSEPTDSPLAKVFRDVDD